MSIFPRQGLHSKVPSCANSIYGLKATALHDRQSTETKDRAVLRLTKASHCISSGLLSEVRQETAVFRLFQILAGRTTCIVFHKLRPGLTVTLEAPSAVPDLHTKATAVLHVCRFQGSLCVYMHVVSEFTSPKTGLVFVLSCSFYLITNYLYCEDLFYFVFKLRSH